MAMDYKYTSIEGARQSHWWLWRRDIVLAILITAVLSSIATFGIISLITHKVPWESSVHRRNDLTCGNTFEDAHRRGCTFDALTVSWLRPECSRHGLKEFLEAPGVNQTWRYWKDEDGLLEIPTYEALSYLPLGSTYWTTQKEHLYHCMWMLLRMHDAIGHRNKRPDALTTFYDHSKHCLSMMVEQAKVGLGDNLTRVQVSGDVGFNVC
jgi:hypothetical protein